MSKGNPSLMGSQILGWGRWTVPSSARLMAPASRTRLDILVTLSLPSLCSILASSRQSSK